ncbi:MAG: heterodisulfide reductase-related iron-sulfur binding cluster [Planctomycetota bacterium]|jgi:Fe-S oxidoreductase/nitrate reductase gamma subunit
MNPIAMAVLLLAALGWFTWSMSRRWRLLAIGQGGLQVDQPGERLRLTLRYALGQRRMSRYPLAGLAHKAIFFGFLVLLVRGLILFGRGFTEVPAFGYWIFDHGTVLGNVYGLIKDIYVVLVILGTLVFLYFRLVAKPSRMTLSFEGIVILVIILVMMVADVVYDGTTRVVVARAMDGTLEPFSVWEPLGSILAPALASLPETTVRGLWHIAFWSHVSLILIFLNILPYTKHFHVITAIPNVFLQDLHPAGRLQPIEDFEGRVEREETLGVRRIDQLSRKGILDLYTCTECGRCTDHCPAARTGKLLSPKQLTIHLRDHLYGHASPLMAKRGDGQDLVPDVIEPEVLWACTTCGACEQECPVLISYVDKIVDLRRHLVQERGEFPGPLQEAFGSMEVTGSPYGVSSDERLAWAEGLEVPLRADVDEPEVLFWVGCAPATDERAKSITRAVARLLDLAAVKWAVLGPEETCTGDVARRAGNEYLFQAMAQQNVEILNRYNTKRIVTACPHCYNTLAHEYPDFGGNYEVVHHTDELARLVAEGRLKPKRRVEARVAYHDSCYLGRYNDIYDPPRDLLASIPGVTLVEAVETRDRGMCCGAGGGQMFKEEEEGKQRVSVARTRQLVETGADTIGTACPFCKRMITDALAGDEKTDVDQLDVAEILLRAVDEEPAAAS